ncbi:MAG: YbaB/EbfC family nucleoid-associated protein [Bacilli bacterium]|nr:YbaB/EbfC family nucleoid-associated protein [Bacilli bacterium]
MNMQQMMIQAQKMQRELQKAQDALAKKEFTINKAGLVNIVVFGNKTIKEIKIEEDGFDPDNKEMIEELIVSGLNELFEQITAESDAIQERITGRTGLGF